jgi:hypothetical protein
MVSLDENDIANNESNNLLLVELPFFDCLAVVRRQLRQPLAQQECMDHMDGLLRMPFCL